MKNKITLVFLVAVSVVLMGCESDPTPQVTVNPQLEGVTASIEPLGKGEQDSTIGVLTGPALQTLYRYGAQPPLPGQKSELVVSQRRTNDIFIVLEVKDTEGRILFQESIAKGFYDRMKDEAAEATQAFCLRFRRPKANGGNKGPTP